MSPISILVIGLGELGYEVVRSLAMHDHRANTELTVMLRKSTNDTKRQQQASLLSDWNVAVLHSDVVEDTQDQLAEQFRRFHTVICCTGMSAAPEVQIKIAKAAIEGEVTRYFPWQFGIDYDQIGRNSSQNLFDSQLDVRDLLRSQEKMQWVIISTVIFIPFVFEPAFGLVNADRSVVTGIGSWENVITATTPEDIGRVVAEIALMRREVQGVVFVSGDTVSMRQLADVVEEVMGREVRRVLKSVEELEGELRESPDDGMRKYRDIFAEGKGTAWAKEESFNVVHGIETWSMADWAKRHL